MGSRFNPCIKEVDGWAKDDLFECIQGVPIPETAYNRSRSNTGAFVCTVEEMCGWGGFPTGIPDQW